MCGIVGGISKTIKKDEIEKIVSSLKHRGPDGSGSFYNKENNIFLGHTRLSIIDLSSRGSQPMKSVKEGGETWISFNGEIYNYKEIKEDLSLKGYVFTSDSDTEVVLKSYIEWGVECVKKFRGMFAFAIWDDRKKKLFLFRDRFGVKPLYYYKNEASFVFASELKAIYSFPGYQKELNYLALGQYLQFGYIPAPLTIFKNTFKIKPGSYLEVDLAGNYKEYNYWQPMDSIKERNIKDKTVDEITIELEKILETSFQYRMVADVDVGIFLSSGVDSSLVAALLQKDNNKKIKTFTIGFKEKEYNEAEIAKKIANNLGTDHHEYYLSANDVKDSLNEYVEIFDEPFGDSSALVTYLLAKNTRQQVKVALSGDGGDELFAGYSKYEALDFIKHRSRVGRISAFSLLYFSPIIIDSIYKNLAPLFGLPKYTNFREKINKLRNVLSARNFSEMFTNSSSYHLPNEITSLLSNSNNIISQENFVSQIVDPREQMQVWDLQQYLPDDILVKTDRTTMAVGLEAREPFLDQSIWNFITELPLEIRYKNIGSKYLLKKILAKYLPEELLDRPKTGFKPPIYEWLKRDWADLIDKYLSVDYIKKQNIFNIDYIQILVTRWQKGKYVNPDKLWLLIAFQLWYERWLRIG